MARAAKDAAAEDARIADQVRPGQERAHGVSEEEIGLVREDLGRAAAQLLDVVHHVPPAVLLAEIDHGGVLDEGLPVAQMVVGHHHEAIGAQELSKGLVAR